MVKGISATQRTLAHLRQQGCRCDIVERFNPFGGKFGVKHDLFNIIDIIALDPEKGLIGIQSTTGNCHTDHIRKLTEKHYQETYDWLRSGVKLEMYSWRKILLKRGGKAMRWKARITVFSLINDTVVYEEIGKNKPLDKLLR